MSSSEDRRAHPRFSFEVEASIRMEDEPPAPARTIDVSYSGICLQSPTPIPVGTWIHIDLRLLLPTGSSDTLDLPARVVWCTPTGGEQQIGAKFAADMSAVLLARLDVLLQFLSGELDLG